MPPTGRRTGSASSKPTPKGKLHKRRLARTRRLFAFDRGLGTHLVAGADEAGRGCLAGPLVAAAVMAKVTRDRSMRRAAAKHPGWGFEEHVGYSTPEHREAIERIGISPLHRRSFQSVAYSQLELG